MKFAFKLISLIGSGILGLAYLSFGEALSPIPALPVPLAAVAVVLGLALLVSGAVGLYLLRRAEGVNSDQRTRLTMSRGLKALELFTMLGSVALAMVVLASFISPEPFPALASSHWAVRMLAVPALLALGWESYKSLRSQGVNNDAA
jgi:hypothetical protein